MGFYALSLLVLAVGVHLGSALLFFLSLLKMAGNVPSNANLELSRESFARRDSDDDS
jgi:hypothetical protein